MRVCLVYDCLFPWTVGGAERWMLGVGEALVAAGHDVTYITRRQWDVGNAPAIAGMRVVAVSPYEPLYGPDGNRTISEAVRFGRGTLGHLLRHGRSYDVVHTASFPYFSLLAAGAAQRFGGYRLIVDWHEVWSDDYWREYLGGPKGQIARAIQRACAMLPQEAFCFAQMTAERLRTLGLRSAPTVLRGEYDGALTPPAPCPAEPLAVFAGRMIPEKRAPAVVPAVLYAQRSIPELRATIFGDGPQLKDVRAAIADAAGADRIIAAPGFAASAEVADTLARACCLVLPSIREGYGQIVVEAAAKGVPSVLVRAPDNAAVEHIVEGVNGYVCADSSPAALGDAIATCWRRREALRASTRAWFDANARQLSLKESMLKVLASYGVASARR